MATPSCQQSKSCICPRGGRRVAGTAALGWDWLQRAHGFAFACEDARDRPGNAGADGRVAARGRGQLRTLFMKQRYLLRNADNGPLSARGSPPRPIASSDATNGGLLLW